MANDAPPAPATLSRGPGRALIPLGAALCFVPFVSTGFGLLLGLGLSLSVGNPYLARTRKVTSTLLALAVVGLGAGMDLRVVARVGAHGILYTLTGIATALALAAVLTRVLRVDRNTGILIGVGTAICGGSAIAAIVPVLKPREHEVSVALGTVFLLNAIALFIFPPIGRLAGLSDAQFGLWSALAIHDTSSVVGAATKYGPQALVIGTTVKLARALWIVPLALTTVAIKRPRSQKVRIRGDNGPRVQFPWFIPFFVLAAVFNTYLPALARLSNGLFTLGRLGLTATLFLIGSGISRSTLKEVGWRPLLLGVLLWLGVGFTSLYFIRTGFIAF